MATDNRVSKMADTIVNYSVFVKKGETVIISASTNSEPLIKEVYKRVIKKGAFPHLMIGIPGLSYYYYKNASEEQLKKFPEIYDFTVKHAQKYIGIGAPENTRELTNVDPVKISMRDKVVDPVKKYIVNGKPKIYRCTTAYPTSALAQEADMSLEEYEDFFFGAVNGVDYPKLSKRLHTLKDKFNKAKKFRVIGEDTDLEMDIYPNSFTIDDGKENLPGGEIFGAPDPKSVNGYIRFTFPAIRNGNEVTNIYCEFKEGKCIKATADKNEKFLNKMLDTDAGSRYLGEIGIGMNPKITKFTKDLLFDEKIGGTVHFAFGMAYKECGEPNKSALHWDIVKDLRKGGQILLDGKVVQKNGKWLI